METARLLADELPTADVPVQSGYPMDASRVLLGLMQLSRQAEAPEPGDHDPLEGIIPRGVLRSLLGALQFRDVATVRHSRRVAQLAVGIAGALGWDGRHLKLLEAAALLHDIGKIGVPDNILFKPGKLSPDEADLMALHYNIGYDVLQACRADRELLEVVRQSHQHFNGDPGGFRKIGAEIHQGARILAVADAYDSLATEQVYRKSRPHADIMQTLMESAGTQFDGNVVCALARWVETNGLPHSNANDLEPSRTGRGDVAMPDTIEASALCHIFSYLYVLESLYDGFYLLDSDLRFVVWNRGSEELLSRPSQEMLGQVWTSRLLRYAGDDERPLPEHECPLNLVISDGRAISRDLRIQHADGRWIEVELQSVPLVDDRGRLQGVAEIFRDLHRTSRRPQEYRDLKIAATRDPLTGVANRGELETQLALLVAEYSCSDGREPFSVIFLDIDYFKSINDTYGHTVGDEVLVDLARLLQHETYSGELVGRYGGEEFVVLCPSTDLMQTIKRAERLRVALSRGHVGNIKGLEVTASFGVTQSEPGDSIESIIRRADKALYKAKELGRNRTCSYTTDQILSDDQTSSAPVERTQDEPFRYTTAFQACVAADMIVYKLGGFVNDHHAKLMEVAPRRAVLRLGRGGLLPFWGNADERRPVEIEIEFGEEASGHVRRRSGSPEVPVEVRIRPLGWIRSSDVFQSRARRVIKLLRAYFAASGGSH
ncbi:MAG: diguanylate cyclase [Planctomycetaceae bacterium]